MAELFFLRHQPLKTIYLGYVAARLLFVRLPLWSLRYLVPAFRPRPTWTFARSLLIWSLRDMVIAVFNTTSFKAIRVDPRSLAKDAEKHGLVWMDATPELLVGEVKKAAEVNGVEAVQVAGYWYGKRGPQPNMIGYPAGPNEKVILQLHSGGWVIGDASPVGICASLCTEMLEYNPEFSRLLSVEYRLSQGPPLPIENPFPAALIDAVAAYHYLVKDIGFKPANILVTGDSAGGNLALALTRYLAESAFPDLPPPGGLFLMSPSGDWGKSHNIKGSTREQNVSCDWVHGFIRGYCTKALVGRLPPSDAELDPYISPSSLMLPKVEGLFKGLPPTLIQVGGVEMTLDQVRTLRDRMKADLGDNLTYIEVPDGTHVLLSLPWHETEKRLTYREVRQWMESVFA